MSKITRYALAGLAVVVAIAGILLGGFYISQDNTQQVKLDNAVDRPSLGGNASVKEVIANNAAGVSGTFRAG